MAPMRPAPAVTRARDRGATSFRVRAASASPVLALGPQLGRCAPAGAAPGWLPLTASSVRRRVTLDNLAGAFPERSGTSGDASRAPVATVFGDHLPGTPPADRGTANGGLAGAACAAASPISPRPPRRARARCSSPATSATGSGGAAAGGARVIRFAVVAAAGNRRVDAQVPRMRGGAGIARALHRRRACWRSCAHCGESSWSFPSTRMPDATASSWRSSGGRPRRRWARSASRAGRAARSSWGSAMRRPDGTLLEVEMPGPVWVSRRTAARRGGTGGAARGDRAFWRKWCAAILSSGSGCTGGGRRGRRTGAGRAAVEESEGQGTEADARSIGELGPGGAARRGRGSGNRGPRGGPPGLAVELARDPGPRFRGARSTAAAAQARCSARRGAPRTAHPRSEQDRRPGPQLSRSRPRAEEGAARRRRCSSARRRAVWSGRTTRFVLPDPSIETRVDAEAELCVVIGRRARDVPEARGAGRTCSAGP